MRYAYPEYRIDLPEGLMRQCVGLAPRILREVGVYAPNDRFLAHIEGKPGVRIASQRVYFDEDLTEEYVREFTETARARRAEHAPPAVADEWGVTTAGFSMMTIDVETEEIREGTTRDLRDMIRLTDSFGVGGSYMIMPQEVPPLMRTLVCFKTCWEMSDKVRPYDYQQPEQLPFLYEMHQVMGKTMDLRITIPTSMTIDPKDLDIFLEYYSVWKRGGDFRFCVGNYPMLGILKPVTATGCATMMFCEGLAVRMLFKLFDPEIDLTPSLSAGRPTDLRSASWAFGSPRGHVFSFLGSSMLANLLGEEPDSYMVEAVHLETSSCAVDAQAALEKMGVALMGAMLGARTFNYAGTLAVDDLYSGTQFVIDLEIVEYIKESLESFSPHPDIVDTQGLYEEIVDVALGRDMFLSHPNTVRRFRNVLPSPDLIVREKLRPWLSHHKTLKDRAREVALQRLRDHEPAFHLPEGKQRELDRIYAKAERALS